ncbi:unnamed protein product [Pleuronectes platessa]|uniref:Uncharacterized protein n=1 Tax=Pleuronectes platessa TaxID=8262 RepID=A0A9N7YZQ8_PLEPL|nr:unnamed protein product [Pleuronectes platessa]
MKLNKPQTPSLSTESGGNSKRVQRKSAALKCFCARRDWRGDAMKQTHPSSSSLRLPLSTKMRSSSTGRHGSERAVEVVLTERIPLPGSPVELCCEAGGSTRGPSEGGAAAKTGLLPMTTRGRPGLGTPRSPPTPLLGVRGHAGVRLPVPRKVIQESRRTVAFTAVNCAAARRSVNAGSTAAAAADHSAPTKSGTAGSTVLLISITLYQREPRASPHPPSWTLLTILTTPAPLLHT